MRKVLLGVVAALALSACAAVPHGRGDLTVEKEAATQAEVDDVFARYRDVRNSAISLLDPKPLSTVETGAVLAIDSGSFEVSQRLAQEQEQDTSSITVGEVLTPRFARYPLWFMAVVEDSTLGVNRIQIFQRESAVDPWLLVASPETLAKTVLPELRRGAGGSIVAVDPANALGMSMSPEQAATTYAKALATPDSAEADAVADDSFVKQMRRTAETNAELPDVGFSQTWGAEDVEFAVRTSDGGALAFVTLLRLDTYTVKEGLTITWPESSPQRAFLSDGITRSGKLRYYHQVLLYIPGGDDAKPRALGQYGGVVSADTE